MNTAEIVLVVIAAVFLILTVRQEHPVFAVLIGACAGVWVLLSVLSGVTDVLDFATDFIDQSGIGNENLQLVLKAVGICYITQFASDLCADAGEVSLAGKIELAGRIGILVISLPMVRTLFDLLMDVMEWEI